MTFGGNQYKKNTQLKIINFMINLIGLKFSFSNSTLFLTGPGKCEKNKSLGKIRRMFQLLVPFKISKNLCCLSFSKETEIQCSVFMFVFGISHQLK